MLSFLTGNKRTNSGDTQHQQHGEKKRSKADSIITWECCICRTTIRGDNDLVNLHLSACLEKQERAASASGDELNDDVAMEKPQQTSGTPSSSSSSSLLKGETATEPILGQSQYAASSSAKIAAAPDHTPYKLILGPLSGLLIIHDFITVEEEAGLVKCLDEDPRVRYKASSWNGRCDGKWYGMKTQFGLPKEIRAVTKGEHDLPDFVFPFLDRLQFIKQDIIRFLKSSTMDSIKRDRMIDILRNFKPNECNVNSYERRKRHSLQPHFDDRELSGPALMNLSLLGNAKMTYTKQGESEVAVDLPRRCLQLVTGDSRYKWKHSIKFEHLLDERRVSLTCRQAGFNAKKKVIV